MKERLIGLGLAGALVFTTACTGEGEADSTQAPSIEVDQPRLGFEAYSAIDSGLYVPQSEIATLGLYGSDYDPDSYVAGEASTDITDALTQTQAEFAEVFENCDAGGFKIGVEVEDDGAVFSEEGSTIMGWSLAGSDSVTINPIVERFGARAAQSVYAHEEAHACARESQELATPLPTLSGFEIIGFYRFNIVARNSTTGEIVSMNFVEEAFAELVNRRITGYTPPQQTDEYQYWTDRLAEQFIGADLSVEDAMRYHEYSDGLGLYAHIYGISPEQLTGDDIENAALYLVS